MTIRRSLQDRRGIALPLVLMLTVFLTISVGAGFIIAGNEHTVGVDHDAQLKAFAVAQQGVENYLVNVTSVPVTLPDTRTYTVTGGTATVTMTAFRHGNASGKNAVYAITSVGDANRSNLRRSASTPVAERSISQFVVWQAGGTINSDAALVALNGLTKNGVSGTVSGVDAPDGSCGGTSTEIPGLAVPDASLYQNGGNNNWIDGNPDNTPVYIGTPGVNGTARDSIGIDWLGILNGSIAPDFTFDSTMAHPQWPSVNQYRNWPVVLYKGSLDGPPATGYGILIVTGNLTLSSDFHGVALVGGWLRMNGASNQMYGQVVTGLNIELGQTVAEGSVGNGNIKIQYNSCDVGKALANFGGWRRVQNTWADNWPSYTVP